MVKLAAAAAQSRRLSASFFSLGIPGEEQEVRGGGVSRVSEVAAVVEVEEVVEVDWASVVVVVVVIVLEEVVEVVVFEVSGSFLGSGAPPFPFRILESCRGGGGIGLRNVSLPTEMNALPGVEKGREGLEGSKTFLSCLTPSSVVELPSFTPAEDEEEEEEGLISATVGSV